MKSNTKHIILGFIILQFSLSCKNNNVVKYWSLVSNGDITLPLDSTTGFTSFSIQFYKDDTGEFLYTGNYLKSTINIYDLKSRSKVRSIQLSKDGPNNVGTTPWAFYKYAKDSIFILSHWEGLVSLVSDSGTMVRKKLLTKDAWGGDPIPWASTDLPMFFSRESRSLIIPGIVRVPIKGYSSSYSLINWDIISDSINYEIRFPVLYDRGFWVDDSFIKCYWSYDLNSRIIYAFAADPFIRSTSGEKYDAESIFLEELKPVTDKYDPYFSPDVSQRHVFLSGYYSSIICDYSNKVYYRVVYLPIDEEKYNNGERDFETSIIIFNENFIKKGETRLPKDVSPFMFFLANDGLFIANKGVYKENEDSIRFDRYLLNK